MPPPPPAFVAAFYMALISAWRELLFWTLTYSLYLWPCEGYKGDREMNGKAKGEYEELCSWLTIRHTWMIIGWEDASRAVSKKCTPFLPFHLWHTQESVHHNSFFSLPVFFWRMQVSQQRVPSSLSGRCDYLEGATLKRLHCIPVCSAALDL